MIDIHSHILPGLDDGASSMAETLAMVGQLYQAGFRTLIATPHVLEGTNFLSSEEILATTDQVRTCVAEAGIPIELLPGAENYIFPDLAKWVGERKLLTLGNTGKYLLLELPMLEIPHYTDQVFFELQVLGVTPVLAHPERNKGIMDQPERLVEWANKGVLLQLDLRSLSGYYGPQPKQLAELMLQSGLYHFTGSDIHRPSRKDSTYLEALQSVEKIVGEQELANIALNNPQFILAGTCLPTDEREYALKETNQKKRNRFWSLFRR